MNVLKNVQPVSFLKKNADEVVRQIRESQEPMMITVDGTVQAVIQDSVSYQKQQDQIALLQMLALGRRQIEEGKTTDHDAFFAELEREDGGWDEVEEGANREDRLG